MKNKKTIAIFSLFASLVSIGIAHASDASTTATRIELHTNIRTERQDSEKERHDEATTTREEIKNNRQTTKDEIKTMRADGASTTAIRATLDEMRLENKNTWASTTADMKAKRATLESDIKKQIANFKNGVKVSLDAKKKENLQNHLSNLFTKLEQQITNLQNIDTKIKARIQTDITLNLDVTTAQSALVTAEGALTDASNAVAATQSALSGTVSDSTTVTRDAVLQAIQNAEAQIKNARGKFSDVIKALPEEPEVETTTNATTTVETNESSDTASSTQN